MIIDGKEIKINREDAVVSEVETAYCDLAQKIINEGVVKHNRTGVDTIALRNGWMYTLDISKAFPIMETKKVNAKNLASEIQWIHQVQSNEVKWLQDRDNNTWNQWVVDEDGIYREYEQGASAVNDPDRKVPLLMKVANQENKHIEYVPKYEEDGTQRMIGSLPDEKGNPRTIKRATWFGREYAGTIGIAYGGINNITKKPQNVEWTLKNDPDDRRMQISLWQDEYIPKAVLPSCVWASMYQSTELYDENGNPYRELSATVIQRSADVPIGLPFNIAQYALLVNMFAKANNMKVGTLNWDIRDVHIYVNQLEGIKKQIQRYKYMLEYSEIIKEKSDYYLESLYDNLINKFNMLNSKALEIYKDESLKMSARIKLIKEQDESLAKEYEEAFEKRICFEHMVTRKTPTLELADHDSIFDYSTDYAKKGDPYLNENPIGNKELVLKNYHPTPFISMPIAQ